MCQIAQDTSDPYSQKAVFTFFGRAVQVWCSPESPTLNGNASQFLPGFERFVYERLVPTAFSVLSLPQFNPKDGQMLMVSCTCRHMALLTCCTPKVLLEIANFLQIIYKTRKTEAHEYFVSVFLPSQNWPADAAMEFTTKLRDLDNKGFRKYFTEVVRSSKSHVS